MQHPKINETFYSDVPKTSQYYTGYNNSESSQKEIPVIVDMKKAVKGHKKKHYNAKPSLNK